MDCHGSHGPPAKLSPEALPLFSEGIHLILSRWTALRLAVENEWGGRSSRQKFDNLVVDLISWFTASKDILYIDELETMLDENMLASFNAEIEDGSVEEVAEQLMTLHEECLQGNFESLLSLRSSSSTSGAVSGSRQVIDQNEDDSSDEDMALDVDMQEEKSVVGSSAIQPSSEIRIQNGVCGSAQEPNHASDMSMDANVEETKDAADGWTVITSKRNREAMPEQLVQQAKGTCMLNYSSSTASSKVTEISDDGDICIRRIRNVLPRRKKGIPKRSPMF